MLAHSIIDECLEMRLHRPFGYCLLRQQFHRENYLIDRIPITKPDLIAVIQRPKANQQTINRSHFRKIKPQLIDSRSANVIINRLIDGRLR